MVTNRFAFLALLAASLAAFIPAESRAEFSNDVQREDDRIFWIARIKERKVVFEQRTGLWLGFDDGLAPEQLKRQAIVAYHLAQLAIRHKFPMDRGINHVWIGYSTNEAIEDSGSLSVSYNNDAQGVLKHLLAQPLINVEAAMHRKALLNEAERLSETFEAQTGIGLRFDPVPATAVLEKEVLAMRRVFQLLNNHLIPLDKEYEHIWVGYATSSDTSAESGYVSVGYEEEDLGAIHAHLFGQR